MDPNDDDIDISFFDDELPTTEAASTRVRLPRRGGSGTGGRSPRPVSPARPPAPVLRMGGIAVVAIVVLLVFGLLIQSCGATSRHDVYASYMSKVATIARSSSQDGQQVTSALTTPNAKASSLADKLDGVAAQERQNVAAARRLAPPGRLRAQNDLLVDALQLRVDGTQGLADTFRATAKSSVSTAAALLEQQANRLLASDVVYDDLFRGPAIQVMKGDGVVGVSAPESHYVTSQDEVSQSYWSLALQRLRGTSATGNGGGGAVHGTNVASTTVEPGGHALSTTTLNTVTATTDLAFLVDVHDGGTAQEVRIAVTLTIDKPQGAIVKTQTIPVINPGKDVTLRFPITEEVPFAQKTTVKVDVATVPHEANVNNNTASYPVIFSLGG